MNTFAYKTHMLLICGLLLCGLPAHARDNAHGHRVAQSPPSFMDSFIRFNATTTPQEQEDEETVPTTSATTPTTTVPTTTEELPGEEATSTPPELPEEAAPPEEEPEPEEVEEPATSTPPEEADSTDDSSAVTPVFAGTSAPPSNPYDTGSPLSAVQTALLLALAGTSGVAGTLLLRRPGERGAHSPGTARSERFRATAPERY